MSFKRIQKGSHTQSEFFNGTHRFEHWYVDNQVYFITARVRNQSPVFLVPGASDVFWDCFETAISLTTFTPWVTSLMSNHYHLLGYLKVGTDLPLLMQRLHGGVAKRVNDLLPRRVKPFWIDRGRQNYFDGCIRDENQARRAYRYTLMQSQRHGICADYRDYPNTRVAPFSLDRAIARSHQLNAFMEGVPYKRYQRPSE
jgi:REP element-mobilizing transposase RayT